MTVKFRHSRDQSLTAYLIILQRACHQTAAGAAALATVSAMTVSHDVGRIVLPCVGQRIQCPYLPHAHSVMHSLPLKQ